jgi:hypothetical protein
MSDVNELMHITSSLPIGRVKMLAEIAKSLSHDAQQTINPESNLVSEDFAQAFAGRLLIHHALSASVMKKKRFEYALLQTAHAVDYSATLTRSSTNPGEDIRINGITYSLKTEAARNIQPGKITISKFQEARWIRDCHTPAEFAEGTRRHVGRHLAQYERILMLRVFALEGGASVFGKRIRYNLVEIPLSVLRKVLHLPDEAYSEESSAGSSAANVEEDGRRIFRLTLDGSVEKVTIRGLSVDACIKHGSWIVPLSV